MRNNEELLYRLFGINAELLIDHAWGWEPCEIKHIKAYKPESNSISVGQVLQEPYTAEKARIIVREMTDGLIMDLVEKELVTDQVVLTVGYDTESVTADFNGEVTTDWYGRKVPKMAHSSENIGRQTASTKLIMDAMLRLYDRIVDNIVPVEYTDGAYYNFPACQKIADGVDFIKAKGHTFGNSIVIVEKDGLFYMLNGDITYMDEALYISTVERIENDAAKYPASRRRQCAGNGWSSNRSQARCVHDLR